MDTLAARAGIQASFCDARGDLKTADPDTLRALLGVLGFDAKDNAAAHASLEEFDRAAWARTLPPVLVVTESPDPLRVALNLPAGTKSIAWRIDLEDGTVRSGEARVDALELLERHGAGGAALERRQLVLDGGLPAGYHTLHTGAPAAGAPAAGAPGAAAADGAASLIVTPGTCWLPDGVDTGRRLWGMSAQLYLLRSAGNWGIGDFSDLAALVHAMTARGADIIGLNPLHAMFLDAPDHASPYSPASRLLLNVLNIDVDELPELIGCEPARDLIATADFRLTLLAARNATLLDYTAVAALKVPVLRLLFGFAQSDPTTPRWRAFCDFRRASGATFERGVQFLALREHFAAQSPPCADWHAWPLEYRDPASPAVARFATEHADLVAFHAWLQFAADVQLGEAARAARSMAVGLYRDLAVGADRSGAETWVNQTAVVADAQVGAPPDIYNPAGQDWGLPPFNPYALRNEGYRSFIELVRANMRHAGGLRIDHVMGLQQLYWVPKGCTPDQGAYVRYPLDDLVGILALESRRNRCLVVGEDLGTVPEGFRERMAAARILSYRVLFFEKDDDGFLPPARYPVLSVAVAGSHDLPTLRSWWSASDLELKQQLDLYPTDQDAQRAVHERTADRRALSRALEGVGLGVESDSAADGVLDAVVMAAHAYLARSESAFALMQIDDVTGETAPVNVPTTSDEHPNWRRRQSVTLEELEQLPRLADLTEVFRAERRLSGASR